MTRVSGVFERVATTAEKRGDLGSTVVFDVEEKPRYLVAYGVRREEAEGLLLGALSRPGVRRGVRRPCGHRPSSVRVSRSSSRPASASCRSVRC